MIQSEATPPTKGLILSITDFTDARNGGGLWSANLLETMALVPAMEFVVVSIGPESIRAANSAYVHSLGMEHIFVPLRTQHSRDVDAGGRMLPGAFNMLLEKFYFPWEREARRQQHVDAEMAVIVAQQKPGVIVINYLYSALFAPCVLRPDIPACLITLNDEAAFQRELKAHGGPVGAGLTRSLARLVYRNCNWLANSRVERFEKAVYSACAGIVALTRGDLPEWLPERIATAILPPVLPQSTLPWTYRASRRVFFVGSIGYYPNRLAIEWMCVRLAPELERLDAAIRLTIIGASAEQVPEAWRRTNVDFLGFSDRQEVVRQMTTADLFVAPIANTFGAKLKLAECVSYGTPFLATPAALSGLPFLQWIPQIDLAEPAAAARRVAGYLDDPHGLQQLSESIIAHAREARARQPLEWRAFLMRLMDHR
jgi:glycosyltransferase involved in cell wall biosynthesis